VATLQKHLAAEAVDLTEYLARQQESLTQRFGLNQTNNRFRKRTRDAEDDGEHGPYEHTTGSLAIVHIGTQTEENSGEDNNKTNLVSP